MGGSMRVWGLNAAGVKTHKTVETVQPFDGSAVITTSSLRMMLTGIRVGLVLTAQMFQLQTFCTVHTAESLPCPPCNLCRSTEPTRRILQRFQVIALGFARPNLSRKRPWPMVAI